MKFCSFSIEGEERFGCELESGRLIDLKLAGRHMIKLGDLPGEMAPLFAARDLKGWLNHGKVGREVATQIREMLLGAPEPVGVYRQRDTRLLAPIRRPGKIIAIGLNYLDHAREQNVPLPERPLMFAKFPTAVIGHDDPIRLPSISEKVDPEAELCIVILEKCRRVKKEDASQVAAFMVGNDVSARDLQFSDKQWVRGKSCDTFAPCGPFIVTGDEVGDPHNLKIELKLNDEVQQSSNTRELIFNCWELIEFITQSITLEPGDIIFTGTPHGVGVFREPPVFLKGGDLVEVTIEKIGTLRNPVVAD